MMQNIVIQDVGIAILLNLLLIQGDLQDMVGLNAVLQQIVLENIGAISIDDVLELNFGHDYIL